MLRSWMLGGLCAVALASASASWGGIVETRDGRTIEGDVIEQGDQVIIDRHGMRVTLNRSDIKSISSSNSITDEYTRRHDKLAAGDVRGRLELARWLLDKKQYDLARQTLMEAHQFSLRNPEVLAMQHAVDRQQDLDQLQARKRAPMELADAVGVTVPATAPTTRPTTREAADGPIRPLTTDEINVIRQNEWNLTENIRVTFKGDVRRAYMTMIQMAPAEFNRMTPQAMAAAILKDGTPDMKTNVIIAQDPVAIVQYKILQRSVVSGCAVCHTAGKTGSHFALIWPAGNDAATYANFLLLCKFSAKAGDREYHMIDRVNPTDSLLMQFALPPTMVTRGTPAHPNADGKYKGIPPGDVRFKRVQEWLTQTLNPQMPDYSTIEVGPASAPPAPPAPAPKK